MYSYLISAVGVATRETVLLQEVMLVMWAQVLADRMSLYLWDSGCD